MYRFNISAPGKVPLFGDFITESNETCVVASLNIRTRLSFASIFPRMIPKECIQLHFSKIHLKMKIPLNSFLRHFFYKNFNRQCPALEIFNQVKRYVQMLNGCNGNYDPSNLQHRLSLEAFFSLLVVIAYEQNINITSSFIVKISTDLPIARGLGSSLSFTVCLAACFFRWSLLQKGIVRYEFPHDELDLIGIYAGYCDEKIYNSMCPMDTSVIVNGGITVYEKNTVLLVFSNISRKLMNELSYEDAMENPLFTLLLNCIHSTSEMSAKLFENNIPKILEFDETEPLFMYLQDFCEKLSLFTNGKMTCSNKGRYAFILLPPKITIIQRTAEIISKFKSYDLDVIVITICGRYSGVRIDYCNQM
ncbi:hypothetical protein P5V15_009658 [Pogonomyrmex californicus]